MEWQWREQYNLNMKIAFLTSGILPIPATQGGAVEMLVDYLLEYNDKHRLHDITVYSVCPPAIGHQKATSSTVNHYHYIDTNSLFAKVRKRIHSLTHKHTYYHYSIDYFFRQALKSIRRQDFDVVILENRPGYALLMDGGTKPKLVYHLHNDILNSHTRNGKELYQKASKILTVSDYIKKCVQTCHPQDSKTVTIHNGIDLTPFLATPSITRESLKLEKGDFVMVFCGRLVPEKGILELIEAMNMLKAYPSIKLLVMGSSFYGNADTENSFIHKLKVQASELADNIRFTGYVKHELMADYLRLADVAVIPSTWDDPFPTSVLEGMAAGLPIITTDRGGIPEMVTSDNAIVIPFPSDFTRSLSEAILSLYRDQERRKNMGNRSRQIALKYTKETYARSFFDEIGKL